MNIIETLEKLKELENLKEKVRELEAVKEDYIAVKNLAIDFAYCLRKHYSHVSSGSEFRWLSNLDEQNYTAEEVFEKYVKSLYFNNKFEKV